MPKLYTREEARAIDQKLIKQGIPGYELMSRAGASATKELLTKWPDTKSVIIFCGFGNNAGDGFIVASLLKDANIKVKVISIGDIAKFTADALLAYQSAVKSNVPIEAWDSNTKYSADIFVDALLGTGLNKPIKGAVLDCVNYINSQTVPVLSIDIPTGLDANTGIPLYIAIHANVTVTFIVLKKGLFTDIATQYCGKIILAPLV